VKSLSARQAVSCETARTKRCRCRCGGLLHGAGRFTDIDGDGQMRAELPADDPHNPARREPTPPAAAPADQPVLF
jgi:hypothetical protein